MRRSQQPAPNAAVLCITSQSAQTDQSLGYFEPCGDAAPPAPSPAAVALRHIRHLSAAFMHFLLYVG